MTLTITLDADTERGIASKAARLGISPAEYLERLAKRAARPRTAQARRTPIAKPESAAETLKKLIGSVHGTSGPRPGVAWSDIEAACDDH